MEQIYQCGNAEGGGVVFGSRQEMKIFSTVFRDFGKNMVGKTVFSTLGGVGNYWRKQQKIGI